jgi:hypothetical protein
MQYIHIFEKVWIQSPFIWTNFFLWKSGHMQIQNYDLSQSISSNNMRPMTPKTVIFLIYFL